MTEVKRLENNSKLCSLLERYLDLNPTTNATEAIFQVTTTLYQHPLTFNNFREYRKYLTNSDIIKGLESWLYNYDETWSTTNETDYSDAACRERSLDNVVVKLNDEDFAQFEAVLNSTMAERTVSSDGVWGGHLEEEPVKRYTTAFKEWGDYDN